VTLVSKIIQMCSMKTFGLENLEFIPGIFILYVVVLRVTV